MSNKIVFQELIKILDSIALLVTDSPIQCNQYYPFVYYFAVKLFEKDHINHWEIFTISFPGEVCKTEILPN